jgi:inner membrane protein
VDPICHTLVGAALGQAGLKRHTALAMPTLLIGANLPDIDVAAYLWGPVVPLAFRRGWTHGVLAVMVLPLVLTGIMLLVDALAARRQPGRPRARPGALLLLAGVSVATHPLLDLLNTYGIRLLMPLRPDWFYGDTLFIADPWVWIALAAGIMMSRSQRVWPARVALAVVGGYIVLMAAAGRIGVRALAARLDAEGIAWHTVMVAPVPANPFRRAVLVEGPDDYHTGMLSLVPPTLSLAPAARPRRHRHPAAVAAAGTPDGRYFLRWSRFPYYLIDSVSTDGYLVRIMDARYNAEWASVTVRVPRQ